MLMGKLRATIALEWGYEMHSLTLTARNWNRIKAGKPLIIRGKGYDYEGQFFWDHWFFAGGLEGTLRVTYGNGGGEGFNGKLVDAQVSEHE
jgi:hypothetical protein